MKKHDILDGFVVVGEASEIKAVYKSLLRGYMKYRVTIRPSHCDFPKFVDGRVYGLSFHKDEDVFYVLNSNTIVRLLMF